MPEVNGYGRGDLLVNVNVWIPKTVNKEELKIFEKFKDSDSFTPEPDKNDKGFFERMKRLLRIKPESITIKNLFTTEVTEFSTEIHRELNK